MIHDFASWDVIRDEARGLVELLTGWIALVSTGLTRAWQLVVPAEDFVDVSFGTAERPSGHSHLLTLRYIDPAVVLQPVGRSSAGAHSVDEAILVSKDDVAHSLVSFTW